jgi:3-isopropylmalate/(R)-2-methylmalate dehydratase small subunit
MLQYGIQAIVAPSFGEIFYSNAMGNRLLLVQLPVEKSRP